MIADPSEDDRYGYDFSGGDVRQLDFRPAIEEIVRDLRSGAAPSTIAARFHNTLAHAITALCVELRAGTGLARACLSGGTFQNCTLLKRTLPLLRAPGFEIYLHRLVPPNDGGIALGQAAITAARL
jgi:hydrogenase maturation protein HypF